MCICRVEFGTYMLWFYVVDRTPTFRYGTKVTSLPDCLPWPRLWITIAALWHGAFYLGDITSAHTNSPSLQRCKCMAPHPVIGRQCKSWLVVRSFLNRRCVPCAELQPGCPYLHLCGADDGGRVEVHAQVQGARHAQPVADGGVEGMDAGAHTGTL